MILSFDRDGDRDDDLDGDGVVNGDDCVPADAKVFPGAPELCDGLDNNCNDAVDDNPDCVEWIDDWDGDGFDDFLIRPAGAPDDRDRAMGAVMGG